MSESMGIQEVLPWVAKLGGGGGGLYVVYKILNVWAAKLNLNLQADQANAAMRAEFQALLTQANSALREARGDLDTARDEENECKKRLAVMESEVDILKRKDADKTADVKELREEVERLSKMLLHGNNPGLEGTKEFDARLAVLQAKREARG